MKKPEVILVIAVSLDGRIAFPKGGASHIGSDQDKRLLNKSLSSVDATLFGSGTLKTHQSTYLVKKTNFLTKHQSISTNQPISIIAGNSKNFSSEWNYFQQPITRWLISSKDNIDKSSIKFDRTFLFKNSWKNTLDSIKKDGISRIALLGGAQLIYSFAKEDLIDQIKITICPKIIGGIFTWIPFKQQAEIYNFENRWEIKKIKVLKTNEIFIHYTKKSSI